MIVEMVKPGASVLDLGCGDGMLLSRLVKEKKARVQGIEVDAQAIYKCVARGLSVFHGDIDSGLSEYNDNSFDYVILSQTFQQVQKPDDVLRESLRVGKEVIVSFPNFAHISARFQMAFKGRTPVTPSLPYEWFNTPNLHFLSILDFIAYCRKRNIKVKKSAFVGVKRRVKIFPNLLALIGIFLITNSEAGG
ncbi:MAG: methionine biosynthesis protein MetW [Chloroflexi bacterium RBG_16_50_9]|nr:MAG: methionine biosynthesis protein MetW [Chloroflexi bacterium RBG_16_50_9]